MDYTKTPYLEKVIERLHFRSDVDVTFLYTEKEILDNMDYINWCDKNRLSPYKCLTFLHDYINGNYDISEDLPKYY